MSLAKQLAHSHHRRLESATVALAFK